MNCLDTSSKTLTKILEEKDPQQRMEVARNTNTPTEILTILTRDEDWSVRWGVERNPNATREIIQTVRAYEFYKEMENTK